jgi:hypothetical protein
MEHPTGLFLESKINKREGDSEYGEYLDLVNVKYNLFDNIQFVTTISQFLIDKNTPKEYYYFKSINKQCREIAQKYDYVYCISNYFCNNISYNYSHIFFENFIKYILNNHKDSKVNFAIEALSKTNPEYFSKLIFESIMSGIINYLYENINKIFLKYNKKLLISENILEYMGLYCDKKIHLPTKKKFQTERENFFFLVLYHIYIHKDILSGNHNNNIKYEILYDYLDSIDIDMYLVIQNYLQSSDLFRSISHDVIIKSDCYFSHPDRMNDENVEDYYKLVYLIFNIYLFKYKSEKNCFEIGKYENIEKKYIIQMINTMLKHIISHFAHFYDEFERFGKSANIELGEYIFNCIYHQLNIYLPLDIKTISKKFFAFSYNYEEGYPISIFSMNSDIHQ